MWTKEKIDEFMSDYGFKPKNTKSEVKELPNILQEDEELRALLDGMLKRVNGNDFNGAGLVIATNKRIIFFRKSFIGTISKEEIPLRMVTSSGYRKGLMMSGVVITTANNEASVEYCDKKEAEQFNAIVQELLNEQHSSQNNAQTNQSQPSNFEQLEKLFELKQKGIITEDEFNQQKGKLLQN